jgi:putative aldouronate transport system substrate-binding protein
MIKKSKRFLTVLLTLSIAASLMSGCKKAAEKPATESGSGTTTASYPIKTDVKLTYWLQYWPNPTQLGLKSFNDTKFAQEWQKKTGVQVEFISPTSNEQFNLMLASADYPDIIDTNWYSFPGGPEKAIGDGHIIKLNDALSKYSPNLTRYLKANAEVDKMIKTDTGSYYVYPMIRGDKYLQVFQGPMIRKDYLDELGLKVPETIDDWTNVLKAFKDKKGVASPLSFGPTHLRTSNAFIGAFGVPTGSYVENGKVKFGRSEAAYKEFLTLFKKWYSEGLLDKNFATTDDKTRETNITSAKSASTVGNTGGGIGNWTTAGKKNDPKFTIVATPYPTLKAGEKAKFGQWDLAFTPDASAAISSKCKNVEVAARFLDWGYSEAGTMLFNFGIEGESYKMENGYPKYTELITKNPQGIAMGNILPMYARTYTGPFIQDKRYMEQNAAMPEQQESLKLWSNTDAGKHAMPRITLTPEESAEAATINNEVSTYANEMLLKFVMGSESLDNYDKYVEQLKKLKLDRWIELNQKALDRYNKR